MLLSTAINCCSLALIDAGIPLRQSLAAVTLLLQKSQIFLDPTAAEEKTFDASFTFVLPSSVRDVIILSEAKGEFTQEQYFKCCEIARESVDKFFAFERLTLQKRAGI